MSMEERLAGHFSVLLRPSPFPVLPNSEIYQWFQTHTAGEEGGETASSPGMYSTLISLSRRLLRTKEMGLIDMLEVRVSITSAKVSPRVPLSTNPLEGNWPTCVSIGFGQLL